LDINRQLNAFCWNQTHSVF